MLRVAPGQARNNFYEINKISWLQDKHDVTL
jgi:hypothetical protein